MNKPLMDVEYYLAPCSRGTVEQNLSCTKAILDKLARTFDTNDTKVIIRTTISAAKIHTDGCDARYNHGKVVKREIVDSKRPNLFGNDNGPKLFG